MKSIGICTRSGNLWGGDIKAIQDIKRGLEDQKILVRMSSKIESLLDTDFIFLTNSCLDLTPYYNILKKENKKYGVICFHEDFIKYIPSCMGLVNYIDGYLNDKKDRDFKFTIEQLIENPEIIKYYNTQNIPKSPIYNIPVMNNASVCIANTEKERETILRDYPKANVQVINWNNGMSEEWGDFLETNFLKNYNLKSKEYLIQVGRFEPRKNQISTIISCKDIDIPIVFIVTEGYAKWYDKMFAETIKKAKIKNRIIIISNYLKPQKTKNIEVYNIKTPKNNKLPTQDLKTAFIHAAANVHPAFYELPGYTYLEAASVNTYNIASNWTTISEYIKTKENILYSKPYDFNKIKENTLQKINLKNNSNTVILNKTSSEDIGYSILNSIN